MLPSLSRRFSLLRTPAGEPVTVDDLRSKFAEHRAKGSQHTISEEEEDMLLETFSRLRGKPSGASQENVDGSDVGATTAEDESGSNTNTTIKSTKGTSSATSSPSSRSTKRYSNNMFGSGRMRDYTYLRSVASSRTSASGSTKTHSLTPSEASSSTPRGNTSSIADSLRPSTPTGTSVDESVQSSPCPSNINDQGSLRSTSSSMDPAQPISAAEYRLQKSLAPAVLKRASLALESVIKELEDDVEEEIVMPRSTPIPRNHVDHNQHQLLDLRRSKAASISFGKSALPIYTGRIAIARTVYIEANYTFQDRLDQVQKIINGASGGVDVFGGAAMGLERKPSGNGISAPALNSSGSYSSTDDLGRSWSSNRAFGNSRPTSPLNASVASQNSFSDASHNLTNSQSQNKHRSATPTQITPRSPSSPTFDTYRNSPSRLGKRSSKQNGPSSTSPFDLGPLPSLTLNSRANLSSSSLLSTGSSFHSWDDNNDRVLNIFDDIDAQPAWHDFSSDKSTTSGSETQGKVSSSNETTPDDDWEPEEIIRSYAGLKKADFATIQEKLVAVAKATEHRGSALRKRRPSTSQSNYSTRDHRVASPPPPASPVSNVHSMAREQQKAIEVQSLSAPSLASSQSSSSIDREFGLRRNLAQVLFGEGEDDRAPDATVTGHGTITANSTATANSTITGRAAPSATTEPIAINPNASVSSELAIGSAIAETSISELLESAMGSHPKDTPQSKEEPASPAPSSSYLLNRNPSTSRIPQSPQDQAVLAREIQQKAQAATLALHKPLNEAPVHTTLPRKRIDPSQISSPTLVSSSASVDTIPLKTPSLTASTNSGSLKIGSRFKRLRGSIRAKVATVDENASINSDTKSPPTSSQMATYDHDKLRAASGPNSSGPGDGGRYKVSVPSPPASAGPGLKGFMARFRTKRMTDIPQSTSSPTQGSPHIPAASFSPLSPSHKLFPASPTPSATHFASNADSEHAPVDSRPEQNRAQFTSPASPLLQQGRTDTDSRPEAGGDSDALQQLFAAANKIGIDQSALNDLLLPQSFTGQAENLLTVPTAGNDKNSATYDSVYELYGDSRATSMMVDPNNHDNRGEGHLPAESTTGVEVIELANGETIWKIVNGLRDDDDDSFYPSQRNSISSEYSTREGTTEGLQVFVKEHVRSGSKGSHASFLSRKKSGAGKARPDTKIMYSSPEQIAHLIEQLSHGMDAGSFNFRPYRNSGSGSTSGTRSSVEPGHSATSSLSANEITWTMKEIDSMLTSMSPKS
ncbi:hypothetical protein CC1G_03904 [Coprinopsis cinerea okayama7|uniref:Uncharacterized protein n=1 Tax=Coprinopsis cinerea (strain Okayama-7 / 130 / ATCC MYA-4618 / FGSC 9003) TaxID=240176 RepID=A8NH57_COPC7|nr:hypothetical protein CC1G_03904 [Coprinopsis cinerea okayama7\|eukprot:XP_001833687.2 hypothetical protein CC1G_03904 [Coprinopsis cinerea okayama7\